MGEGGQGGGRPGFFTGKARGGDVHVLCTSNWD